MLIHIVAWKYKTDSNDEARDEHRKRLKELPGIIPGILGFDVGEDILKLDRSYDTGLVARFEDLAALEKYTVHEAHQLVANMGKEVAQQVVSVDFIVE